MSYIDFTKLRFSAQNLNFNELNNSLSNYNNVQLESLKNDLLIYKYNDKNLLNDYKQNNYSVLHQQYKAKRKIIDEEYKAKRKIVDDEKEMINNIVSTNYSNMYALLKNYDNILNDIKNRKNNLLNENQSIYDVIHKLDNIGIYKILVKLYKKFIKVMNNDSSSYETFYNFIIHIKNYISEMEFVYYNNNEVLPYIKRDLKTISTFKLNKELLEIKNLMVHFMENKYYDDIMFVLDYILDNIKDDKGKNIFTRDYDKVLLEIDDYLPIN